MDIEKEIKELKEQQYLDAGEIRNTKQDIHEIRETLQEFISVYEMENMVDTGLLAMLGGEKTVNEVNNPMSSGSGMKTETDSKPPEQDVASSASHTEEMNKRTDHLHDEIHELKDQFTNNHLDLFPDWINDVSLMKEVLREVIEEVYLLVSGMLNLKHEIGLKKNGQLKAVFNGVSERLDNLNRKLGGEKSGGMKDTIVNEVIQVQHSKPPSKLRIDEKVYYNKEQAGYPNKSPSEQDINYEKLREYSGMSAKTKDLLEKEKEPISSARQTAKIERIIEIYDNGHESVFYPYTHMVVEKEDLEDMIYGMINTKRSKKYKKKYLEEDHE